MAKFTIDGTEYNEEHLAENAKLHCRKLVEIDREIAEKTNLLALLNKARKAYISDLKSEMLAAKAGIDFNS
jgi:hypothetical protein